MADPERASPWARNVVLLVGFIALVVIGILTVLLPELEEAPPEQNRGAAEAASEPEPAQ